MCNRESSLHFFHLISLWNVFSSSTILPIGSHLFFLCFVFIRTREKLKKKKKMMTKPVLWTSHISVSKWHTRWSLRTVYYWAEGQWHVGSTEHSWVWVRHIDGDFLRFGKRRKKHIKFCTVLDRALYLAQKLLDKGVDSSSPQKVYYYLLWLQNALLVKSLD